MGCHRRVYLSRKIRITWEALRLPVEQDKIRSAHVNRLQAALTKGLLCICCWRFTK